MLNQNTFIQLVSRIFWQTNFNLKVISVELAQANIQNSSRHNYRQQLEFLNLTFLVFDINKYTISPTSKLTFNSTNSSTLYQALCVITFFLICKSNPLFYSPLFKKNI